MVAGVLYRKNSVASHKILSSLVKMWMESVSSMTSSPGKDIFVAVTSESCSACASWKRQHLTNLRREFQDAGIEFVEIHIQSRNPSEIPDSYPAITRSIIAFPTFMFFNRGVWDAMRREPGKSPEELKLSTGFHVYNHDYIRGRIVRAEQTFPFDTYSLLKWVNEKRKGARAMASAGSRTVLLSGRACPTAMYRPIIPSR